MNSTVQLVLAATASFFFVTLLFAFIYLISKSSKHRRFNNNNQRLHHQIRGFNGNRTVPNPQLSSVTIDESATFDPNLNRISMDELKLATNNFSPGLIIGDGSFGFVYKATLSDGTTVAIKKLDPDAFQGFREFRAEMETLGKLHHPNIVRILGYCISGVDRVLIYEFIEKGNLDQWLHETSTDNEPLTKSPLSWEMRIKIVMGIANGLAYLHQLDTPIIHRDIKASNVLLDGEFEAHIADFGLARAIDASHSHVSTQVAGTMGYMPPEYKEGVTVATVRADVFSFGILMIEIATGERPNLPVVLEGREVGLIVWARKMLEQDRHVEILDSKMCKQGLNEENVKGYFSIASMCTNEIQMDRPVMSEVVHLLNQLHGRSYADLQMDIQDNECAFQIGSSKAVQLMNFALRWDFLYTKCCHT
ncbi:tyrosine-sulfated glycopeptide receptor 1 isoform X7 [Ricinus communis]|uniref:tyrosine-sulfated glycopeptide receptor 1 isoform X7 n=1 Tax=Ricinus communis TaxID=3988 RepID=UPI00201AD4CF|nr:tyrosine-sulfated glycopeptide receptor 1 isoform X7 [Ricinus communis]